MSSTPLSLVANEPVSAPTLLIIIFDTVAAASCVSLAIPLLPAIFNPNIQRTPTWFSMIGALMVFPLTHLMTVHYQLSQSAPPLGLCLFQAFLVYAGPPSVAATILCHIANIAFSLSSGLSGKGIALGPRFSNILLLFPPIIFSIFFMLDVLLLQGPTLCKFDSSRMFCITAAGTVNSRLSAVLVIVLLFLMVGVEAWIFLTIYKNWQTFTSFEKSHDLRLSVFIRFGIFTVVLCGSAVLGAFILPQDQFVGGIWNIFAMTVPLIAGIVFGTHGDILRTWACWIFRKPLASPLCVNTDEEFEAGETRILDIRKSHLG